MFTINTTANAFTKTVKDSENKVLRAPIEKFEFSVNLDIDLESQKMQEVIKTLIIDALKSHVQAIDRTELWHKDIIASKFSEFYAAQTEESIYKIVCESQSSTFGLVAFKEWFKTQLLPAIIKATGKVFTEVQLNGLCAQVKAGVRMPQKQLETALKLIDTYGLELPDVEKVLHYLTNVPEVTSTEDLLDGLL